MLYLKEFKNHSGYTQEELNLVAPNVSYCDDANDVHYKQKMPNNSVLFTCYNIQPNTTEEVKIQSSPGGGVDTISVDKNDKLYKFICTSGFHKIYSDKDIISSVTLNNISQINNTGQSHWFSKGVKNVSIKDCTLQEVSQLTNMCNGCTGLVKFEATNFNTSKATSMESAFSGCYNLTSLDLSGFKITNITNMQNLFSGCQNLKEINMSGWNLAPYDQTNSDGMFGNVSEVNSLVGTNGIKFIMKNVGVYTKSTIETIISNFNRDLSTAGRPNITYSIEE